MKQPRVFFFYLQTIMSICLFYCCYNLDSVVAGAVNFPTTYVIDVEIKVTRIPYI